MTPEERAELEALRSSEGQGYDFLGGAETLVNSAAFGLGDEIGAAANALWSQRPGEDWSGAYSRLLDESQARTGAFAEENPLTATALKVAPAVLTGVATAPKLLGQSPNILRTLGVGVGEAGYYGAAEARQDERTQGAMDAAPFGLLAPAAQTLGGAYRGLKGTKAKTADQIIADAMEASGMNRGQVANALTDNSMLADVSPQFKAIGMGVANMTPNTRQAASALDARAGGMTDRVQKAIKQAAPTPERLSKARKNLVSTQAAKAKPLYQDAYNAEVPLTPELKSILETNAGQKAYNAAKVIASNDKRALPEIYTVTPTGQIKMNTIPDMQAWDDIKRGFDTVIEQNTDITGKVSSEGRQALMLKNELLGVVDDINPAYKVARDTFAGDQAIINAMDDGKRALNMSVDDVIEMTETISKSERESMLKGMVADIAERMGRRGDNTIGGFNFMNNNNARVKIMAMLGDDPKAKQIADNIIDTVANERNFAQTRVDVLGGSQTHIRKQAEEALHGAKGGMDDVTSVSGALREMSKKVRAIQGISRKDADDLAGKIFDPDMTPKKINAILKDYDLSESIKTKLRALSLGAGAGGAVGAETLE